MRNYEIRRHGNYIRIEKGLTAVEGNEGNLPTLAIRRDGKCIKFFRGSSLYFSNPLTAADKEYLKTLSGAAGQSPKEAP